MNKSFCHHVASLQSSREIDYNRLIRVKYTELYKTNPEQVIIAGGGYAGIQAALTLEHLLKGSDTEISLIDKNAYHTLLPSLPEIISNRGFLIIDYKDIIQDKKIEFIQATITNIDLNKKLVNINDLQNTAFYNIFSRRRRTGFCYMG